MLTPITPQFPPPPQVPVLVSSVVGDWNGDGYQDLAGLDAQGNIWVLLTGTTTWRQIPGHLDTLVAGDLHGEGRDELAGLQTADHSIWRSHGLGQWERVYGWLQVLVVGDFNGDGRDDLAGISWDHSVWMMTDGQVWHPLPGPLVMLDVDHAAPGHADLLGWNGSCWLRMRVIGSWDWTECFQQLARR